MATVVMEGLRDAIPKTSVKLLCDLPGPEEFDEQNIFLPAEELLVMCHLGHKIEESKLKSRTMLQTKTLK